MFCLLSLFGAFTLLFGASKQHVCSFYKITKFVPQIRHYVLQNVLRENGEIVVDICCKLNIPDSTVPTIKKKSNQLECMHNILYTLKI